jgi:hypothetical protein
MRRAFRATPFDIVNTHSSTDTWLTATALRLGSRTRPVLVRTRHVSVPVPNDTATSWLYRKATTRLITTGESLRATLIRDNGIDPARIESIPTGIDGSRFAPGDRLAARAAVGLAAASGWWNPRRCAAGRATAICSTPSRSSGPRRAPRHRRRWAAARGTRGASDALALRRG